MADGLISGIGQMIGARRGRKASEQAYKELEAAYQQLPDMPGYAAPEYQRDVNTVRAGVERAGFADPGSAEAAKQTMYQSAYGKLDRALNAIPGYRGGVATGMATRAVGDVFTPLAADIENMARQHGVQRAQMQQQASQFDVGQANQAAAQFADARNRALQALALQGNQLASTDAMRQYQAGVAQRQAQLQQAQDLYNAQLGKGQQAVQSAQMFGAGMGGVVNTAAQAALMGMGGAGLMAGAGASPAQQAAMTMLGWGQ